MKPASMRKFSSSKISQSEGTTTTRKSVPGPTTPAQFVTIFLFSIFRKPVSIDAGTKAGIFLCISAAGSLVFDIFTVPTSYFSNKYNLINQIFVKWAWGWTCCSLASFIVVSCFIFSAGKVSSIRSHMIRLVAGSAMWYIFTGFFHFVENATGHCHPENITVGANKLRPINRRLCQKGGGVWLGFDISGHCFLLTMCSLTIIEEVRCLLHWQKLADIIKPYDTNLTIDPKDSVSYIPLSRFTPVELKIMRSAFRRLTGTLKAVFVFVVSLSLIWDIMFIATIVYFHNLPSKILGTMFGVSAWFLTYRILCRFARNGKWLGFAPGMPGDSRLDFVPLK